VDIYKLLSLSNIELIELINKGSISLYEIERIINQLNKIYNSLAVKDKDN
jgi:hypothetical protein